VEFAYSATACKLCRIVQRAEQGGIAVHLNQPVFTDVARNHRQKSCRANVAGVRHEHDPVPVANAETTRGRAALDLLSRQTLDTHLVQDDAPVGWRLGDRRASSINSNRSLRASGSRPVRINCGKTER
jgi:hypothetical protein